MRVIEESEIVRFREVFHEFGSEVGLSSAMIDGNLMITPLSGGSSNSNYHVTFKKISKSFFVKHQSNPPVSQYYQNNLEREYVVSKYLSRKGLDLAPLPYFLDAKRKVLVSEFVYGYQPSAGDKNLVETLEKIGRSINAFRHFPVDILQMINTNTRVCPKGFFEKIIHPSIHQLAMQTLAEGSSALFQFLEELHTLLFSQLEKEPLKDCILDWKTVTESSRDSPHGLVHNDLAFRNIIIRPNGKICFIDFEFADVGDLSYDLAYIISENNLLNSQLELILNNLDLSPRIKERTQRYIRIFLPSLELANAYWTLNHISKMMKGGDNVNMLQVPHTISQNLEYVKWKIRRLNRLMQASGYQSSVNEGQIFFEIQNALKLFEAQVVFNYT